MSGSPPRFHCIFPLTLSLSKGRETFFSNLLILLCHKKGAVLFVPHHGQWAKVERTERACRQRMVVMELGLCRSTHRGSAARAETFG